MSTDKQEEPKRRILRELVSGAVASAVSRAVVAPLDVIKIRWQVQERNHRKYIGLSQTVRTMWNKEGLRGFWKGNIPAELMVIPWGTIQFATFHTYRRWIQEVDDLGHGPPLTTTESLLGGALAGGMATCVVYPLDLLRTQLACQEENTYHVLRQRARAIYTTHGIRGFYQGLYPTMVGIFPYTGTQFAIYENLRGRFLNNEDGASKKSFQGFLVGLVAGTLSKLLCLPFDVVKKRAQVSGVNLGDAQPPAYTSMLKYIRVMIANEGVASLYAGAVPALLKAAPSSAITFGVYEYVRHSSWTNSVLT